MHENPWKTNALKLLSTKRRKYTVPRNLKKILWALVLATFRHHQQEDNWDWEEEVTNQIMVVALPAMAVFYAFLWVNVLRLSRFKRRLGDAVMGALTQTFLQPLADKATQDSHA